MDELTIITRDAQTLSDWYASNFGFMDSKDNSLLYHDNLTIKLIENKKAKHRDSLKQDYNIQYVPGIFKVGIKTNQFDELVKLLEQNNAQFHGSIVTDSILDSRMVIVKDPDNNYIQLFEDNGPDKFKPHFLSLITENVGEQEKWYQVNFPVDQTHRLDQTDQDLFIRLLTGEHVVIELLQVEKTDIHDELNYQNVMGFYSVEVAGANFPFETDHEGNLIYCKPKN